MMLAAIMALVAAQAQPFPPDGYSCFARFEIDGYKAFLLRDFQMGPGDQSYLLQLASNDRAIGFPFATWSVGEPPQGRERKYYRQARPEAVVFEQGPESLTFGDFPALDLTDGAVRARYMVAGVEVGTVVVRTARQTRLAYRKHWTGPPAILDGVRDREIVAKLAGAGAMTVVLVDDRDRELARRSVTLPLPATLKAAFAERRAQMERDSAAFLKSWKPGDWRTPQRDAPCTETAPPEAGI